MVRAFVCSISQEMQPETALQVWNRTCYPCDVWYNVCRCFLGSNTSTILVIPLSFKESVCRHLLLTKA